MKASKAKGYDHTKIEKKWQKAWQEQGTYKTENPGKKKKMYVLDMFPYPSGAGLHVGHPRGYIGSDVYARMKRMEGFNVLHPMGFDSFGLPAEQYAIQTKKHPGPFTDKLIKQYKNQLEIIGFSYDWSREVDTHRPEYYKWTQWIFLKLYDAWYDAKKNKARAIEDLVALFEKSGNTAVSAVTDIQETFSAKEWKSFPAVEQQNILMHYRLAYEGFAEVNWCEELGTVLANDEIVDGPNGPVSERGGYPVIKKAMRQWFMRITAYADRLVEGLDGIDWPNNIKEIQKNWIGKSEGSEIEFGIIADKETLSTGQTPPIPHSKGFPSQLNTVSVFTTRADTLFGVTYIVLAPEHQLVQDLQNSITNWSEVEKYIKKVAQKDDRERMSADKQKTGIELKGVVAVNPANGEQVPVWIADYVLASYGTGAVMAVPAHDERDFAFAQKYDLPIREVIRPYVIDPVNTPVPDKEFVVRRNVHAIIFDPKTEKYLIIRNSKFNWDTIVIGGVEEGEDFVEAALREIREETGYQNVAFKRALGFPVQAAYFAKHKDQNRMAIASALYFEIIDHEQADVSGDVENDGNETLWIEKADFVPGKMVNSELPFWLERLNSDTDLAYTGYGTVVNSGDFDGMLSQEAKKAITKFVKGKIVTKYKMRDAIFARQRYWGEPIPLIHRADGVIVPVKEKNLPLELPNVKSYAPSGNGESPLAAVKSWVKEGYETNTMPGWAGSSWYFLRYMDPANTKAFAGQKAIDYWKDVDMYVGGAEHATGHLLYSRFWHKFLFDMGYVPTTEPFKTLKNQGLIGGADGRKMSKRWGNVINPDDIVKTYGADSLRLFEMFLGPFEAHLPWSTDGIIGSRRFIERVWRMKEKLSDKSSTSAIKILHKTIKKVTEDIQSFSFNTAVSTLMICLNEFEKSEVSEKDFNIFLQLLAPFAPHVADELWNELGESSSIHLSQWPKHNEKHLIENEVTIGVQINGKVRAELTVAADASKEAIESAALALPRIQEYLAGKAIKKAIVIPGKIVNIVIE